MKEFLARLKEWRKGLIKKKFCKVYYGIYREPPIIWKTIISERLDVKIAIEDITYTLVRVVDIWQDVSADPC